MKAARPQGLGSAGLSVDRAIHQGLPACPVTSAAQAAPTTADLAAQITAFAGAPVGIGWRHPHYDELLARRPALAFLEVHSENFFAEGGASVAVLAQARASYPISLHGVGLSLGSACGVDEAHLAQLARLVERVDPVRVSDHASFARAPLAPGARIGHANDLLPTAFTAAALAVMAANVSRVQDRLQRTLLVENLSAYIAWRDAEMAEPAFFNRLVERTGCAILLDVNNLVVNALNSGLDPVNTACAWIDQLRVGTVGEIHLAGYHDDGMGGLVIDDHGSRVRPAVWEVYRHALQRFGTVPTLIEWDTDVPALDVLLDEAALAAQCLSSRVVRTQEPAHVA